MNTARKFQIKNDLKWAATILRSYLMTVDNFRWVTQSTIFANTGLTGVIVRQVCNAYPTLAVSSTSGYKLAHYATRAQIQRTVASLTNRSIKMLERAKRLSGLLT